MSIIKHLFEDSISYQSFDEKMFGGLWQTFLKCSCGEITEKEIVKMSEVLPLEIYGSNIQQCLNRFFTPEYIERTCPSCSSKFCEKSVNIVLEPSTMIIQLKRYEYDRDEDAICKKHNKIIFPIKLKLPKGSSYSLCSAISHIGSSPSEGHYNVLMYNSCEDTFVMLDDTSIEFSDKIPEDIEKLVYIITYIKE